MLRMIRSVEARPPACRTPRERVYYSIASSKEPSEGVFIMRKTFLTILLLFLFLAVNGK